MKPLHELDERVVVAESVGPRAMGRHHQECPRRPPPKEIVRDDTGEGRDGGRTDALEWLGLTAPKGRWLGEPESRQPSELVLWQPSRYSGLLLKVGPEVFGRALLGALVETIGEGDEFSRLDPRKMTLPSSSSRLVRRFSFLLKMKLKACNIKNNNNR
ncbi:hypothetical protein GOBAR_AA12445 [Gossypium barbadense]|uniref:Uncharacterized protein n=1 Tax=Gossypium barbadense TaxID=3634 RepID=A0A2P5XXW8_GOSBA|nr:hypothetical protein GOBAR_AA12445 [Gossypium barbadense]